jgi:hypothetical protein
MDNCFVFVFHTLKTLKSFPAQPRYLFPLVVFVKLTMILGELQTRTN